MKVFIAARKPKKRWHWLLVLALAVLIAAYAYWNMDKHNTGLSSETESSPEDTTGVFHDNEEKSNILLKTATVTNGDDKTAGYDLTPVTPKPESHQTENNDSPTTAPSSPAEQLLEFEKLKSMTDFRLRIQIKGEPAREASPELAEKIAGILKEYKDVLNHLPPYSREILPSDGHYEAVLSFEGLADIHIMPYGLFCFTNVPEIFFDDHMYDHYLMECLKYIEQKENVYYLSKGDPQLLEYEEDEPQKSIQADLNGDGRYEKLEVYYNGDLSLWINDKKYLFEHDKELFRVNLVEREIENWDMVLDISIRPENDGSLIVLSYTHIGADNSHTEFYTMKYSRDDTLMSYSFEPVRNIQSTYENNTVTLILDDYGIKEEISFTEKHYEDAVEYSDMEGISVREYLTGEALFYFSEPYGYFIQDVNIDGVHELNVICDLKREFKFYITVLELTYGLKDGKWQLIDINKHEHTSTPTESSSLSSSEPLSSPVTRVEPGRKFELQTADSDALQARYPLIDLSAVDQQGTYALISSNIRYPDDVNGDKSRDIVLLLSEDHTAVKNPFLLVQDGTTLEYNKIFLDEMSFFSGSNEIHLRTYIDADGDGKNDIIIEAGKNQSSTDGRSLCIFGFPGNIPVTILNWVNPGIQYVVQYAEGYGLQITSEENGLNAVADIEEPAKIAPDKYPFDSQGRPDDLTSPWQAGPIAQYKLVDYDGDGIIEFEIGQYVYNHHGTELLGTAWCLIKKDPQTGGWKPTDTTFTSSCPVMMKNENIIKKVYERSNADVNGDGEDEEITLYNLEDGSEGALTLYESDDIIMLSIKKNEAVLLETPVFVNQYGEAPALFCGDFTGDGASDLMIWRDSGGNGYGYIYQHMYSFKDNNFEEISFQDIKDGKWFSFEVLNDNSARVFVDGLNQSALCALTEEQIELWMKMKSKEYETDRFGIFWDVGYYIPVDLDSDGKYELQCDIWFVAEYRSEIVDLNTVVEYVDGRWIPISCEMVPFETQ